jgi:hypothetical protein
MRCRRCVRRGSRVRGRRGARGRRSSRFPTLFLRLRGCACRHRSRNHKKYRDACVPLEHDTTSYVARINQRRRRRAGFAWEGAAAYMRLTWRATNSMTSCSELPTEIREIEMRLVRLGRNWSRRFRNGTRLHGHVGRLRARRRRGIHRDHPRKHGHQHLLLQTCQ